MSIAGHASATKDVVLEGAAASWIQDHASEFVIDQVPRVLCLDKRSGRSNTSTYPLTPLDQFMLKGELRDWEFGQELASERDLTDTDKSFTVRGRAVPRTLSRPHPRPMAHRLADIETQIVPGFMSILYQGMTKDLISHLANATTFTSKTWTGTGTLQSNASSDHIPLQDIQHELEAYRKYQGRFSLECWGDERVFDEMSLFTAYHGAGVGSNSASKLDLDEFLALFQRKHRLDRVVPMRDVSDSVRRGQTSSLKHAAGGLLWFGLVDRSKGVYDVRSEQSSDRPDGALMLAVSRDPEVVSKADDLLETEKFDGRTSYTFYAPRANFGFFYPGTQNLDNP